MVRCLFCGKALLNPKIEKGRVIKKFCNDKCRWDYHNRAKFSKFTEELMVLFKKYGYLRK